MVNYNVDRFLGIANKNKEKYGVSDDYIAMVSMFRVVDDKLYVVVPLVKGDAKVWTNESNVIPEYWTLIDPIKMELIEFNKTSEKNFINGDIKENMNDGLMEKEMSKYIVNKRLEYKSLIKEDIKNKKLFSYQKKIADALNNIIKINEEEISLDDYFYANLEDEINEAINKLVDLIVASEYNSITAYYDILFNNIIEEYINENKYDIDKIKLACEIISLYYPGVDAIENLFNI